MLHAPQEKPPAVEDMLSFNTLTPHYEEDVIYALNSKNLAQHLSMDPATTKVRIGRTWRNQPGRQPAP